MVSKNFDEQHIRQLFQSYGTIEDCTILRDSNGKSRGNNLLFNNDLMGENNRMCVYNLSKTSMCSQCNKIDASITNDGGR